MSGEINPDLDALAGEVARIDNVIKAEGLESADSARIVVEVSGNEVEELAGLLGVARDILVPMLPSLAAIYTPAKCTELAAASLAVMKKHGWSIPGMLSKWGEEFALAVVAVPVAFATYKAVKMDIAAADREAARVAEGAPPGQKPDIQLAIAAPKPGEDEPVFAPRG